MTVNTNGHGTRGNGQTVDLVRPSEILRAQICQFAKDLLDAPYRWGSVEAYEGSHCAQFGLTPYQKAGLIKESIRIPVSHRDWMNGKDVDPETFRNFILQFAEEVPFDDRQSGDLVTFIYNGLESHVGILMDREWFIHNPSGGSVMFQRLAQTQTLKSVYRHNEIIRMENNGN